MVEIKCIEGTKVYVYAKTASMNEQIKYSGGTQRIYEYGFLSSEITPRLMRVASEMYIKVCGVYASNIRANSDYIVLSREKIETQEDNIYQ